MNVLVISSLTGSHYPDRFVGGIERCSEQMTELLTRMGHDVALYALADHPFEKGFELICAKARKDVSAVKRNQMMLHDISVLIAQREIDVVISNSAKMWAWGETLQKDFPRLKIVHIEHMTSESFGLNRYGHFARMCKAHKIGQKIFMASKRMMPEWSLANRDKHDIIAGKNGLTLDDVKAYTTADGFYMAATAAPHVVQPSNGRAIFIGRASEQKRPVFAAKLMTSLNIPTDFFVSENVHDTESADIIAKLREIEKQGVITLHLNKLYPETMDALKVAKFMVCTGLDNFCLVGFEAASFGVPTLFAIKNNLRSGIQMGYDYLSEHNDFVVDVFKKKNDEMLAEVGAVVSTIKDDMQTREAIYADLFARYNIEECKKNMNEILGLV